MYYKIIQFKYNYCMYYKIMLAVVVASTTTIIKYLQM